MVTMGTRSSEKSWGPCTQTSYTWQRYEECWKGDLPSLCRDPFQELARGGVKPKLAAQSVQGQSPDDQAAPAQEPPTQRLSVTTERLEFEVASIRQNKSDATPYANFSIGPGPMYGPTGDMLSTTNMPLVVYIVFAYNIA